jgi:hypothetical protein
VSSALAAVAQHALEQPLALGELLPEALDPVQEVRRLETRIALRAEAAKCALSAARRI